MNSLVYQLTGYKFGYEMLIVNGAITFFGLWIASIGKAKCESLIFIKQKQNGN